MNTVNLDFIDTIKLEKFNNSPSTQNRRLYNDILTFAISN